MSIPDADADGNRPPVSARRATVLLLGASLVALGLNLRLIFPSLSVLLPAIIRDTGVSPSVAGYLTTVPVLCLGAFAPLAPWCARRFGIERTLFATLVLLAVGTALRGAHGIPGLFIGSALAGASIALANVLMPALIKRDYPRHVAGMTALYTMSLNTGGSIVAATTLPLIHGFGRSWPTGVAMWALPSALAAIVWTTRLRHKHGSAGRAVHRVRGLFHSALAWQVTLFMGLQSAMAYCVSGWLAPILHGRGMDTTTAGFVTSVCIFMTVAGSLCVPFLVARFRDQRLLCVGLSIITGGALFGLLFAPLGMVWYLAALQGWGQGSMFTMALTVIGLRSPDPEVAAHLSGMAQSGGYLLASLGPLIIGFLYDSTGGFAASGWLFLVLMTGAIVFGWGAGRALYVKVPGHPAPTAETR